MPIASAADAIVLAVNIPGQAPSPGQATRSSSSRSADDICPHGVGTDALDDVLDVDGPALEDAGADCAAIDVDGRDVEPRHGHQRRGGVLVAPANDDQPIEAVSEGYRLDGVGDDLAAHQRRLHALVAEGDAVADRDRSEAEGDRAGIAHAARGLVGQLAEVEVAGRDIAGQAHDADEGLAQVAVGQACPAEEGAGARPFDAVDDFAASASWVGVGLSWGRRGVRGFGGPQTLRCPQGGKGRTPDYCQRLTLTLALSRPRERGLPLPAQS